MFLREEFCWPFICLYGPCGVVEDSASVLDWRVVVWPVFVHDVTFLVGWFGLEDGCFCFVSTVHATPCFNVTFTVGEWVYVGFDVAVANVSATPTPSFTC